MGGITGIYDENTEIKSVTKFSMQDNYPKPFSKEMTIGYFLPKTVHVELTVNDITGRQIKMLVNESQTPGNYTVNWNIDNELSGLYFYIINACRFMEIKKCILQKQKPV